MVELSSRLKKRRNTHTHTHKHTHARTALPPVDVDTAKQQNTERWAHSQTPSSVDDLLRANDAYNRVRYAVGSETLTVDGYIFIYKENHNI